MRGGCGWAAAFAGAEPGAEEGLSVGFGMFMPVTLQVMLVVPLLVVVVLMCSPFGPILSSTLVMSAGGGWMFSVWAGSGGVGCPCSMACWAWSRARWAPLMARACCSCMT